MIILGIDPGSVICGYGAIKKEKNKVELIEFGVIKLSKLHKEYNLRLKELFYNLERIIKRVNPDLIAIENTFYSKNAQSLIKLSQARAITVLSATLNNVELIELSPRVVKKAITGNGNASKKQVQYMVQNLLEIEDTSKFYDVTDALALAICSAIKNHSNNSKSSWKEYIERNPEKVLSF